MGCNCNWRGRINLDLGRLRSAREHLRAVSARSEQRDSSLSRLGSALGDMFAPTPLGGTRAEIAKLNQETAAAVNALLRAVSGRIGELEAEHDRLLIADRRFHSNNSNNNSN